jgi:urocanate hydratase
MMGLLDWQHVELRAFVVAYVRNVFMDGIPMTYLALSRGQDIKSVGDSQSVFKHHQFDIVNQD